MVNVADAAPGASCAPNGLVTVKLVEVGRFTVRPGTYFTATPCTVSGAVGVASGCATRTISVSVTACTTSPWTPPPKSTVADAGLKPRSEVPRSVNNCPTWGVAVDAVPVKAVGRIATVIESSTPPPDTLTHDGLGLTAVT